MRLDKWLLGLLIMSTIVLTGMYLMADISDNYTDVDLSEDLGQISDDFNVTADIYDTSSSMKSTLFGTEVDDTDTESSMFAGAFSAARFVSNSFNMFGGMVQSVVDTLGIPSFYINIAMAVAIIMVIFAVIYLIMRFQPN